MTITYTTRLVCEAQEDKEILRMLDAELVAWNGASEAQFKLPRNSIVDLHAEFYKSFRQSQPEIPAQIVIAAQKSVLSAYSSAKSNKVKLKEAPKKTKRSLRLDVRSFSHKNGVFSIISLGKRIKCKPFLYDKLSDLLAKHRFCDPLLFVKNGDPWIALTFEIPTPPETKTSVCGVDMGIRMVAVTSEGKFYQDKNFNRKKRQLRFLKRQLSKCRTKSSRKHLKKVSRREHNRNRDQSHKVANAILADTKADVIAVENLKGLKVKKNPFQNKNRISQAPFHALKEILRHKAPLYGKLLLEVSPEYTSQIDHRTGKRDGIRKGRRYYGKDGVVLDADQNAAVNIAKRSKLPTSYVTVLDGQATVSRPIVCKSAAFEAASYKPPTSVGGS